MRLVALLISVALLALPLAGCKKEGESNDLKGCLEDRLSCR
jgi:hypothetical protein